MARVATEITDELGGLRALARSLVRGGDDEDLVQETAVVALVHPPSTDRPVRPWLAAVLRNRWRMDRRGAARREAREAAIDVPESATPAAMLDRARMLERLAAALVALDDPFREAVILRYLDGHSAVEVARKLGVPDGTVRWRVKTGLERLRAALDVDAPRPVWQRALLAAPLGALHASRGELLLGAGVIMKSKSIAIAVAVLVALLVAGGVALRERGWSLTGTSKRAAVAPPRGGGERSGAPVPIVPPRGGAAGAPADDAADPDPLPGQGRAVVEAIAGTAGELRGRVINWSTGDGVAAAELTFSRPSGEVSTVRSGADGGFALAQDEAGTYALAAVEAAGFLPYAPEWQHSAVRVEARRGVRVRGLTIFLFPAVDYRGVVVDGAGQPVAGAAVRLLGSPGGEQALAGPATAWVSDAQGAFVFHAPDDAVLEAEAGGRRGRARLDGGAALTHQLVIRLGDEPASDAAIAGRVVGDDGEGLPAVLVRAAPVADPAGGAAAVAAQGELARAVTFATTDAQGRFRLTMLDRGRYDVAANADARAPVIARAVPSGTDDLRLVLATGAALSGRVVDDRGGPVPAFSLLVYERRGVGRELVTARSVVDASGSWRVQVADGVYTVIATASGWAPSAPVEARPAEPVTLTVTRGAVVRGRVVSGPAQTPLPYARVMREGAGGGASATPANAGTVTRDDGTFELTGIPPGRFSLLFAAGGHHPKLESGLIAVEGGDLGPLAIVLRPLAEGETPTLELVGIGVKLVGDGDALRVDAVVPGGGAEAAGVVAGDRIIAVEGVAVTEIGLDGAIVRIRGAPGTRVRITLARAAGPTELSIERRALKS